MRGGPVRLACLSAVLGLLLCVPAQAKPQPRIIGGHEASQGEYPAQGELLEDGSFICGGSLVSNRYFLTAGHCVGDHPTNASRYSVRLGDVRLDAGEDFQFSALERNAAYSEAAGVPHNDTALFTLSTPAPAADEPIRLVNTGENPLWSAGKQATLIGWGDTGLTAESQGCSRPQRPCARMPIAPTRTTPTSAPRRRCAPATATPIPAKATPAGR